MTTPTPDGGILVDLERAGMLVSQDLGTAAWKAAQWQSAYEKLRGEHSELGIEHAKVQAENAEMRKQLDATRD